MTDLPRDASKEKAGLHPRNKHRHPYPFQELITSQPELKQFVFINQYQTETIDFSDPAAVLALNKALLHYYYGIKHWEIPTGYLCPPIPGRADYVHHIADLLKINGKLVYGPQIQCLDIGTGANCIYPLLGHTQYGWRFIGTDIDPIAIQSAEKILHENPQLVDKINVRWQKNKTSIFKDVIKPNETFEVSFCNPPFHNSAKEAAAGSKRKLSNLTHSAVSKVTLNFGGQSNELWCAGGEISFIKSMITESRDIANSCLWFTSLVSKQAHLRSIYAALKAANTAAVKTISMTQGNKITRVIAWTFQNEEKRKTWLEKKHIKPNKN